MSDELYMGPAQTPPAAQAAANTASPAGQGAGQDLIKETSTQAFAADVLEASRAQPVLVDFWAPWCGPCRQLTPLIESAVKKAGGRVKLVKMNIQDHPAIAGQLGIQSIPAVIAFKDGQPIDGFMGALPEGEISAFIERIAGPAGGTPPAGEAMLEEATERLEQKDYAGAAQLFATVLQEEGENIEAIAGLAQCYLASGEVDKAAEIIAMADQKQHADHPALKAVQAKIQLLRQSETLGETGDMEKALEKAPEDRQLRFNLALALAARGNKSGAAEHLLYIIRHEREWNDEAARKQLLQFFEAWGAKDPATKTARRELSSIMFS